MDLKKQFEQWCDQGNRVAIVVDDTALSYAQLRADVERWCGILHVNGVAPGECIALMGRVSGGMIALLFALVTNANIIVPFLSGGDFEADEALDTAHVDAVFEFAADDTATFARRPSIPTHALIDRIRTEPDEAGLILFTSGSTGKSKASVHRFSRLIGNVTNRRGPAYRSLIFLMFDHIGGINTLLHVLCNGGTAVFVADRTVDTVCRAIERHRVELLPTTPTFLNMLLISDRRRHRDLSSLKLITYGTEPMSQSTLRALHESMPSVRLKQTYGLTEVGILPTRSEEGATTWMKVGGGDYETRIVDGILSIRSDAAMIGYLNAPSPFDAEGWLNTGDRVEQRNGYLRILGRESEIINVGGEKVYPSEVENLILELDNISDVVVSGKPSALTGALVIATVHLVAPEDPLALERRVRRHCQAHLPPFKVPVAVKISERAMFGARFKKLRRPTQAAADGAVDKEIQHAR